MPFAALGLSPALAMAAQRAGYVDPSPVQQRAIPPALQGRDVLAQAPTGSGKTAAYALPMLQRLEGRLRQQPRPTDALVLVPTRELAVQVADSLQTLARHAALPVKVAALYGGVSINPQMMSLRGGAEVLVATPGRLLDLVDHNAVRLGSLGLLVLDEADRLLDAAFADELNRVLALLPARRQVLMFSATLPMAVRQLARQCMRPGAVGLALGEGSGAAMAGAARPVEAPPPSPARAPTAAPASAPATDAPASHAAPVTPATAPPDITQRAILVDPPRRTQLLLHLLAQHRWRQALVFVATRHACDLVAGKLSRQGVPAGALHGELSQGARSQALQHFQTGNLRVLVATDLAARGLHIAGLPVVVNVDLPRSADTYRHRIGRTGRAGAQGLAVSFISADSEAHFRLIEKRQGQRVPRETIAGFEPGGMPTTPGAADGAAFGTAPGAAASADHNIGTAAPTGLDPNGGIKGRRKSKKDKLREAAGKGRV